MAAVTRESTYSSPSTEVMGQPDRREAVIPADSQPMGTNDPQAWGWHGETGKWGRRGAVIAILFTLAMLKGNHHGKVEDLWLIGIAFVMILIMIWDWRRRKNAWRSE